jgi:predicted SpoU family rRNA methylase
MIMYHSGSNGFIENYNGNFTIIQHTNDADIIFKCDDGSGGTTAYLTLDGSAVKTVFSKETLHSDSVKAKFGNSGDLEIQHNGTASIIDNLTGSLLIRNFADDSDIIFETDDGSGGTTTYFYLDGSSATHDGSATTALYTNWPDKSRITVGTSHDLQIYHDATDSRMENYTGNLTIQQRADDKDIVFQCDDGSGGLTDYMRLDGSAEKILMHKSTVFSGGGMDYGVDGTGADVIFYGDTSGRNMKWDQSEDHLLFTDNTKLKLGTSGDLHILHDGTDNYIKGETGDLHIRNDANDKDIVLSSDDGSGNVTPYITLDGSQGFTTLQKAIRAEDNVNIQAGTSGDLRIYHNGSNSVVQNVTGNLTVENTVDDGDLIFSSDDGSGGTTAYITLDGSDVSTIVSTIKVMMPNLPTSNPSTAGQLWNDSGTLKISAG